MSNEHARRVLVLANRTATSDELLEALTARAESGPLEIVLVIPATPFGLAWATDMHAGEDDALAQMHAALRMIRDAGLNVTEARIGDPDPAAAVADAVAETWPEQIVVSTLPAHLSKWLRMSLPDRIARTTGLPVEHVTAAARPRRIRLRPGASAARLAASSRPRARA